MFSDPIFYHAGKWSVVEHSAQITLKNARKDRNERNCWLFSFAKLSAQTLVISCIFPFFSTIPQLGYYQFLCQQTTPGRTTGQTVSAKLSKIFLKKSVKSITGRQNWSAAFIALIAALKLEICIAEKCKYYMTLLLNFFDRKFLYKVNIFFSKIAFSLQKFLSVCRNFFQFAEISFSLQKFLSVCSNFFQFAEIKYLFCCITARNMVALIVQS